ncbi:outer membrane protein assembly factor BamA [Qipengyuania vesicularis]|uniref:outer membrane protein assembly factor BamA n=1 Tax=Qipengyuania vesicularis TaxID=2867232 RepID=UPI001C87BE1F|nr:outer membrane protein assembly factor BamA [Qipengyuania vesicularis]MBX7526453.1 outer membrane protein assembly factor BamA [Qipengyuania vesicularis]
MTGFATAAGNTKTRAKRLTASLLAGTIMGGLPAAALAQETPEEPTEAEATPVAQQDIVRTIAVAGAQRLEPQTILSYIRLRPGDTYTQAAGDQVLKDLYATELFSNVSVVNNAGNVVITLTENPVINRILLEGNKRIKNDKIIPEIRLAPRQIFTRSKVRADVARIIELYKRQGRFAATVEPQMVQLSQNRVDIVFEIDEGPKSKVRQINIIGNEQFSDGELKGEMVTKQTGGLFSFLSSNTSYDPDRLAFDQQNLRTFYLTEGYADFRVVSAVAELTPDKEDFIVTYVVEEGERYKFGDVDVRSDLRDFDSETMTQRLPMAKGDWYNAETVEDTVEQLTDLAGTFGYAFADVRPDFRRNPETLTMDVTFVLREAPRVYVERIDVNGNTLTQDKVVRREFRVSEGDAFNSLGIKRSEARINSLGYFQENFEIAQVEGSAPDRVVLEANIEEQPTGELQLSAGFSSIEKFVLAGSIRQRNFRGRGQTIGLSLNYSRFSRSAQVSFSEPYVFDRNVSLGADIYHREYDNDFFASDRNRYKQATTGLSIRAGVPLTEYMSAIGSYTLNFEDVTVGTDFFQDLDGDGVEECIQSRFICEAIGKRTSSILGLTLNYDTLNNRFRPTRGESISTTAEFAGLGGDVKYLRMRSKLGKWMPLGGGFIFSLQAEGGWIRSLKDRAEPGFDDVRLTDRFFLGEPQFRGFDIRGVGPRVIRLNYLDDDGDPTTPRILQTIDEFRDNDNRQFDDALGGKAYYLGRAEIEIPLGSGAQEMGLRPSVWLDVGSLFAVTRPKLDDFPDGRQAVNADGDLLFSGPLFNDDGTPRISDNNTPNDPSDDFQIVGITTDATAPDGTANARAIVPNTFYKEVFLGNSVSPRITAGIGVNWNSPFGPFRIDISQVIKKQPGDDTKVISFNVGTQF